MNYSRHDAVQVNFGRAFDGREYGSVEKEHSDFPNAVKSPVSSVGRASDF